MLWRGRGFGPSRRQSINRVCGAGAPSASSGQALAREAMHMNLAGKVAIVTGGARGIGGAISRALAKAGADVLIADLRREEAQATACRLQQETGRRVEAYAADVTRVQDMQAAAQAAVDRLGGLDILVNNAGWDRLMPFLKSTPELWDRIIAINYVGVLNSCYAALPHLKARGHGAIVNVSSDSARVGAMGEAVYSGAKAAVVAFSTAAPQVTLRMLAAPRTAMAPAATRAGIRRCTTAGVGIGSCERSRHITRKASTTAPSHCVPAPCRTSSSAAVTARGGR